MKIAVMQPYFFPYIGYWQLMNSVDRFVIFDDVNYINRGWINRNRILMNGNVKYFNLPIEKKSQNKKINELNCFSDDEWKQKLIRQIKYSYVKAPFFEEVYGLVTRLIMNPSQNLADYLTDILTNMADFLEIPAEIMKSSNLQKNNSLKGANKIIEICKILEGTAYHNAIGGQYLYDRELFRKNGLELFFVEANEIVYDQFLDMFFPNLSIIDVLMYNGRKTTKKYLSEYKLY